VTALLAGVGGALAAQRVGRHHGPRCVPYRAVGIPTRAACMDFPWQLAEVGPGARSLVIGLPCIPYRSGTVPRPVVVTDESRSQIRIHVFIRHRALVRPGRFHAACNGFEVAKLRAPIEGRRLIGQSLPPQLTFAQLSTRMAGVPRLLGLAPAQAMRLLQVQGYHAQLTGSGRQIVAQTPGWGLADLGDARNRDTGHGDVTIAAGERISTPAAPVLRLGVQSGVLIGKVSESGPPQRLPVAVFDRQGRLVAHVSATPQRGFRVRLAPGRYQLLNDSQAPVLCAAASIDVFAGSVSRAWVSNCSFGGD
jgi:hypothetical protein